MTREEYIEQYPNPNQIGFEDAYEILEENAEKYIYSLEKHIAELEAENIRISMHLDREREDTIHYCKVIAELSTPKNCDGCCYFGGMDFCRECSRNESNKFNDYYEPKEIK